MSVRLHEILSLLERGAPCRTANRTNQKIWVAPEVTEKAANILLTAAEKLGHEAICFDMGEIDLVEDIKPIRELIRLPYPVCWLEGHITTEIGEKFHLASLCRLHIHLRSPCLEGIVFRTAKDSSETCFWGLQGFWRFPLNQETVGDPPRLEIHIIGDELSRQAYKWATVFLSVLNCRNVNSVENHPDHKLQAARKKRGKKPLFSFWTLELDMSNSENREAAGGGTHASPRLHLCRGHHKRRKTGVFWWNAHARGDKKLGVVHKDYAVKKDIPDEPPDE